LRDYKNHEEVDVDIIKANLRTAQMSKE